MKKFIFLLLIFSFIIGCSLRETARVLGIGVSPFKTSGKINSKIIDKDIFSSYKETEKILWGLGVTPYRGSARKGFMVARGFAHSFGEGFNNSTELAVFFEEIDSNQTKIEVSSLNYRLSDFISEIIFEGFQ